MKNKLVWLAPIVAIFILVVLATAFYPAYNPKPKDVPMAVVNEDQGLKANGKEINIGNKFEQKLLKNSNEAMDWSKVTSKKQLEKDIKNGKYIGAIIIDKDFSKDAMSQSQSIVMTEKQQEMKDKIKSGDISPEQVVKMKQQQQNVDTPEPKQAEISTIVNQGSNSQIANIVSQGLTTMTDNMNNQISKQNVKLLAQQHMDIPSDKYSDIANPVKVDQSTLHKVKDHQANGNAAMSMFAPTWLTSMLVAVITFFAFRNRKALATHSDKIKFISKLVIAVIVAAFAGAFSYVYYMNGVFDFNFTRPNDVALLMGITILGIVSLLIAFLVWFGLPVVPLLMLVIIFTMQAIMLPTAMVPKFYQDYILPWNPFYHFINALKSIIYEGQHLQFDGTIWIFISFMIVGLVSLTAAIYVKNNKQSQN
ncbi:ABC transporter permease [Staphylococcus simiae]|uniref:YhgE/Pip N-terminal domain n=1 Tax=Staphylococcus simiae CCM 7213 = CCUG 51256 TaxID=911238 RepID=G5JIG0_9STAP|nr:ABC transporter permease [Staphylococcus simiae]EHJ08051.1 YhgE/Pip N-terminal domain [Staphylococcus simiae CCM 7213 = CCUG 51256]PNZ14571.1 DUF3533 domain-containing protein [Staphylococcus simiae]SNV58151.1 Phage infection protein [Staphylococcus simiae]